VRMAQDQVQLMAVRRVVPFLCTGLLDSKLSRGLFSHKVFLRIPRVLKIRFALRDC
jgi:hypothetical protein